MFSPEHKQKMEEFAGEHNGKKYDTKAMLHPQPMIAKILIARIANMTDEQRQALKSIATPETADALKALLPEFAQVIDMGAQNG